jgi:phage terminase large subunit-like protein
MNDKYNRLYAISNMIATGSILFPETGSEELIRQLVGFGSEAHDDLVDALTMLVLFVMEQNISQGSVSWGKHNLFKRGSNDPIIFR